MVVPNSSDQYMQVMLLPQFQLSIKLSLWLLEQQISKSKNQVLLQTTMRLKSSPQIYQELKENG